MANEAIETVILRFKTTDVPAFQKDIYKGADALQQVRQRIQELNIEEEASIDIIRDHRKHFKWWALSTLFFSMRIQRTLGKAMTSSLSSMMKLSGGATIAGQAVNRLSVHWELLKFSMGEAIGEALLPLLPSILGFIDMIADFVQQHPEIAIGLIAGYFVTMAAVELSNVILLLSSLSTISISASVSTFMFGLKSLFAAMASGTVSASIMDALGPGGWLSKYAATGIIIGVSWNLLSSNWTAADVFATLFGWGVAGAMVGGVQGAIFGIIVSVFFIFGGWLGKGAREKVMEETGKFPEDIWGETVTRRVEEAKMAGRSTGQAWIEGQIEGFTESLRMFIPATIDSIFGTEFLSGTKEKIDEISKPLEINYTPIEGYKQRFDLLNTSLNTTIKNIFGGSPGIIPGLKDMQNVIITLANPSLSSLSSSFDTVTSAANRARAAVDAYKASLASIPSAFGVTGGSVKNYVGTYQTRYF